MKYQKPEMEFIELMETDIVASSSHQDYGDLDAMSAEIGCLS